MWANRTASYGRWHGSADSCSLTSNTSNDPWYRIDLRWNDGGHIYVVFDDRDEAVAHAARLGFG